MNIYEIIIPAAISLVGVIFSMIVTSINTSRQLKNLNKRDYNTFISTERIKWINELRKDFSELYSLVSENLEKKEVENERKIFYYIEKLILSLNPYGEVENEIIENLKKIDGKIYSSEIKRGDAKLINKLLRKTTSKLAELFKEEWEKTKSEVRKRKYIIINVKESEKQ